MSSEQLSLNVENASKIYTIYEKPIHRLFASLGLLRKPTKQIVSLSNVSLQIHKGEVLGVIGRNGAGKSTLLQLICGTLRPTDGLIKTNGRIAALLELGAGFNLDFTGRENVKLSAALMGLGPTEIANKFSEIVSFAELEQFIDQPVKTYSSGMFMRLAFAVATSVEPDVLVIDEALSVGDGVFARKSFDRIMTLKAKGTTILFCSHALYQVEALSDRVVWLKDGKIEQLGAPQSVIAAYQHFLTQQSTPVIPSTGDSHQLPAASTPAGGSPQINKVTITSPTAVEQETGSELTLQSCVDTLYIDIGIIPCPELPPPTAAVVITNRAGVQICSCITHFDNTQLTPGQTSIRLVLPEISLLKGDYEVDAFLLCENAIHVYQHVRNVANFRITQNHLEPGVVHIPRQWTNVTD